ncbi:MAG: thiamine-phosphate kinase [Micrococcales bacterium]|nr:thiamine-phosphate kinase [Micrococcales bacterium]
MPPQPCDPARDPSLGRSARLADIGEDELLALIFPLLPPEPRALLGPGDDAAVLGLSYGASVLTTDTMVLGQDWRDQWSTGADVGAKIVAQNLADVAAVGAVPAGLLITLIADPSTPVRWALDLAGGIGDAAAAAGTGVLGGDLSSAGPGVRAVSVTAVGDLEGRDPVTRAGARPGDVVAVTGTLGHAAAGLRLLTDAAALEGGAEAAPGAATRPGGAVFVAVQRRPTPPLAAGPQAAVAGVHAMIDLSDGLVRDAGRVARASGVDLDLGTAALAADIAVIAAVLGAHTARDCVLAGGEDHALLGCFSPQEPLPAGWRPIGVVSAASTPADGGVPTGRALVDGKVPAKLGWDHFGG